MYARKESENCEKAEMPGNAIVKFEGNGQTAGRSEDNLLDSPG